MGDKFLLKLKVIDKYPDRALVMEFVNNSEKDYCILGFEGFDIRYQHVNPVTGDTSWFNDEFFFMFSRTTIPVYNPEMEVIEIDDIYNLQEAYNSYPEFKSYYEKMREKIKNNYDEEWSGLYKSLLFDIFNYAIFIKSNEKWSDTLLFGNYFHKMPDQILKVSFAYPPHYYTWAHDTISMKNILHNWQDELGLQMPQTFDGFKVITDEIEFSDSVIVQRVQ
jgi:hypothetical protein